MVATSKPLSRQAYLLLDLAEEGPTGEPVVKLSHTTIAHLLGARRHSVTRVVNDLARRGLVDSRYGHTVLLDLVGLSRVMGSEPLREAGVDGAPDAELSRRPSTAVAARDSELIEASAVVALNPPGQDRSGPARRTVAPTMRWRTSRS